MAHRWSRVSLEARRTNGGPPWLLGERCRRREPVRYTDAVDYWDFFSWTTRWRRPAASSGSNSTQWAEAVAISAGKWYHQALRQSKRLETAWIGTIFGGEVSILIEQGQLGQVWIIPTLVLFLFVSEPRRSEQIQNGPSGARLDGGDPRECGACSTHRIGDTWAGSWRRYWSSTSIVDSVIRGVADAAADARDRVAPSNGKQDPGSSQKEEAAKQIRARWTQK